MNTKASLSILAGVWLMSTAAPAAAHDVYRDDIRRPHHDVRYDAYYGYRGDHRHSMPRWLRRHKGFRHWYSHSRYQRDRHMRWERLWDIYTWERRHRYRHDIRADVYGYDRRGKGKHRRKGH